MAQEMRLANVAFDQAQQFVEDAYEKLKDSHEEANRKRSWNAQIALCRTFVSRTLVSFDKCGTRRASV
jgi:hypothetical protein